MPMFKRKPSTCEAIQWNDDNTRSVAEFIHPLVLDVSDHGHASANALFFCVKSDALVHILPGDWIVKEADGSGFHPVTRDVFASTYEPVQLPRPGIV